MEPQEAWKAGSGLLDPKEDKQPRKSAIITRRANWIRGTGTQISNLILRNQANNPKHEIKVLEYPRKNCASREDTPAESWATFVGIWQPRFPDLHVQNQILQIGFIFLAATETRPEQWDTPPRFGPLLRPDIRCEIRSLLRQVLRFQTVECPRDYLCNRRAKGNKWWSRCFHFQFSFDCYVLHKEKIYTNVCYWSIQLRRY